MLHTARVRKSGAIKSNNSGSKDSKDSISIKKPQKIYQISTGQLKLRQAIQLKFDRSKIRNFRYSRIFEPLEKQKNKNTQSSVDSQDIPQYAALKQLRFINLFDYHKNNLKQQQHNKQFLIKFRSFDTSKKSFKVLNQPQSIKDNKKKIKINTQANFQKEDFPLNYSINGDKSFIGSFQERKTISGQKKQHSWRELGFQYHSASKNPYKFHTRAPSQHDQRNIKLHQFRKKTKSPPPPLRNI